jgi:LysM repeat protein
MLGRVISRLLLLLSPFVLAILSIDDLITDLFRSPEPTPIILTEMTGTVQKLPPAEGVFRDIVVGEVIELHEQVLTHQDSSARLDLSDNWGIQMEPLSAITIQELSQEEIGLYTRVKLDIGTIDVSLFNGTLDVETPSGLVSLHGPARAYLKVQMNTGETWVYCLEGLCTLEKANRTIGLTPGQNVSFSQYTDLSMTSENTESCGPPPDWVIHIVQKGEKLKQLSEFYQVPISAIQLANCLGNSRNIKAGDALFVPNKLMPTPTLIQLPTQEIPQGIATATLQPTATASPTPNPTNTPLPTTATKTPVPQSTNTPKPTSSNAPASYPTNTPLPTWTNTTQPTATNTSIPKATDTPPPTPTNTSPPPQQSDVYYVDGNLGSDSNPGTLSQPWKTIYKAVRELVAGETVYIRGGEYNTNQKSYKFSNSGTSAKPITVSNYPGEQVIIKVNYTSPDYEAFLCWYSPLDSWYTPKADYIRIIGSDVAPAELSNGVVSKKGIVIQGMAGIEIRAPGIEAAGCDNWEVAGIDFIDMAYGIFTKKRNYKTIYDYSSDGWHVHDNRVYSFYRESGMQFNGNDNLIVNNEIYKVTDAVSTPYGCQMLNLLGNNNVVKGNVLSRAGSDANCMGILLEWDIADANLIKGNTISDTGWGNSAVLHIAGGDNNIFTNNTVYASSSDWYYINPGVGPGWPCNEEEVAQAIIPANDPAAPDFIYYYPHDCHSVGNQIYDNTYMGP